MRLLRGSILALSTLLLPGCFLFGTSAQPTPQQGQPQQATVVTTPAAPKPPPEPNLDEIIGADVDTKNPEVFRSLSPKMSRKQVDEFFPGVAASTEKSFVEAASTIPSIHHFRFYFSDDGLYTGEIYFHASQSTPALFEKIVAAGNAKWGTAEANDESARWSGANLKRNNGALVLDVHVDIHRGKAAPLDLAAFVGKGDGSGPPAAFLPYPKTLTKDDARKLGTVEPSSSESFLTIIPGEGSSYDEVEIYYGDYATPRSVTIKLHPSLSSREKFLALRDAMQKRYGKARVSPDNAKDEELEGLRWRAPRMQVDLHEKQIEIEFRYN